MSIARTTAHSRTSGPGHRQQAPLGAGPRSARAAVLLAALAACGNGAGGEPGSEVRRSATPPDIVAVQNRAGTATARATPRAVARTPVLTREQARFRLDGAPVSPFGLRAANVLQDDTITRRFIHAMDDMVEHGIQSFSLTIQGGRYVDRGNSAFNGYHPDGELKPEFALRLSHILDAAAARRMVPVVIFFYRGRDQELRDAAAVRAAVVNTMEFLRPWRHAWVNLINEPNHSGYDHPILRTAAGQVELYRLAKSVDPERIVYSSHEPGANDGFLADSWGRLRDVTPPANGDVMIEYARGWPRYYDSFAEPGVFPDGWIDTAIRDAEVSFHSGGYWFFLAVWHQKADAPGWPRFDKGGIGTRDDPGVAPVWDRLRDLAAGRTAATPTPR